MYPYSDTDTDSDASYQSGDPRKYFWLHSDYDYGRSRDERDLQDDATSSQRREDAEENNALVDFAQSELAVVRERNRTLIARDATRVIELQATRGQLNNTRVELQTERAQSSSLAARLVASEASNNQMVQRIAELCAYLCARWVDHAGEQLRGAELARVARIRGWLLVMAIAVIVVLWFMA